MSEEKKLEKISYKTVDVEQDQPDPVLIDFGGKEYTAYAPSDYGFFELMKSLNILEKDPSSLDFDPLIEAFFDINDTRDIKHAMRTKKIQLVTELLPGLRKLADHYAPLIKARMEAVSKSIAPK